MTFKNKILQEYAEKIGSEYYQMLENGIKGYNAIFMLAEKYNLSRFDIYRYIKHSGRVIKIEERPLGENKLYTKITDKYPIDK